MKLKRFCGVTACSFLAFAACDLDFGRALAADLPGQKEAPSAPMDPWSGFYVGGHIGWAWGNSSWSGAGAAGSFGIAQPLDSFQESGSFLAGVQGGYNYRLPNSLMVGGEIDATFPTFPAPNGATTGGVSNFVSPVIGAASYCENVLAAGTARARIGYAPGNWLYYATAGFAWTHNEQILTPATSGFRDTVDIWRFGWAAGAGVETRITSNWTARLEYLYTGYGDKSSYFLANGVSLRSNWNEQELRAGVNYHFPVDGAPTADSLSALDSDRFNFHAQSTFVEQAYPSFRSPYQGTNSLPGTGEGRETFDLTLFAGARLWDGAEAWINPEIDQGFGFANTHGVAGFPSAESYKLGSEFPYGRIQRYFIRQTINLGGESQKVDPDLNQFAETQTSNRLVLTVGKFAITDIFDVNKYADNAKGDFLNWSTINAATFDYAGDGWGYTYGAAAEYYFDRWTVRGGLFDLSVTPAGGAPNSLSYGLDPNFNQFQMVGEIEERHELWGEPGKIKVTGFVSRGRAGQYQDALDVAAATGIDASNALAYVRKYQSRPGVSVNLEQQVAENVGVFARAGWANGQIEPWDFTDVDGTLEAGVSISGAKWGRPDDTWGLAGVLNQISGAHQAYLNAGGLGILVGDGQLTHPGQEQILETYYNYALTTSTKLGLDYQLIANPAYNTQRGPANFFAARAHWQF
jgi:high affinity Mn2+ porin